MDGYSVWKIHRAVSLHLNTLKYDLFEHNGRVKNSSVDVYNKQNTKRVYEGISRHLNKPFDAVQFFLGNMIYTPDDMTLNQSVSWEYYTKYLKHKESLTKFISDDIQTIDLETDIIRTDDTIPELLNGVIAGRYIPQTVIALNRHMNFIDSWLAKDYFGFQKYVVKLKKLDRFVKYNEPRIDVLLKEKDYATV